MDTSDPMDCESSNTRSGRRFPPLPAVNLQLDTRQFNHNDDYYVFPDYPPLVKANADCSDWNYYARRTSQEVLPGLYLGNCSIPILFYLQDLVHLSYLLFRALCVCNSWC